VPSSKCQIACTPVSTRSAEGEAGTPVAGIESRLLLATTSVPRFISTAGDLPFTKKLHRGKVHPGIRAARQTASRHKEYASHLSKVFGVNARFLPPIIHQGVPSAPVFQGAWAATSPHASQTSLLQFLWIRTNAALNIRVIGVVLASPSSPVKRHSRSKLPECGGGLFFGTSPCVEPPFGRADRK